MLKFLDGENPSGVEANVLDCGIMVSEFELLSRYYVYFWTDTIGKDIDLVWFGFMAI